MKTSNIVFHGSAGTVTGSCFEVCGRSKRILIDCGMFQGTRSLEALNYEPLPFDLHGIDAVILTHAHLDHSGRLPYLVASGCNASIWCTTPTADILEPLLLDSAKLQSADIERRNRRADRAHRGQFEPLYSTDDVITCIGQLRETSYCEWHDLGDGCGFRLWDARHIVGSASVELVIDGQRLLFSGDIGNGEPIACSDVATGGYDHIVCEATYGDRAREPVLISERREQLAIHIETALARGGNLLIPAFAVERTQVVLEDIVALLDSGRLGPVNIFVDSPLAERVTRATLRYRHVGSDPFRHPNIRFTHDVEDSKRLNMIRGAVIIAGSGMCEGGRIRHHLVHNLPHSASRLLLVGYQVGGTLGAVLRDGARHVRISGNNVPVLADVFSLDSYSTHADQIALLEWIKARGPVSGNVFLVHGEDDALMSLSDEVAELQGFRVPTVPLLGETWRIEAAAPTKKIGTSRPDARRCVAPRDWTSELAALKAELDDRIEGLPNDKVRHRAISALAHALERIERP
jgi:metallo-beta-lactamase family protein